VFHIWCFAVDAARKMGICEALMTTTDKLPVAGRVADGFEYVRRVFQWIDLCRAVYALLDMVPAQ